MWRAFLRRLALACLAVSVSPPVVAQSGGGGRGESCIGLAMPCQFGLHSDPRCAARARARRPAAVPEPECSLTGLTAAGLSGEARAWLAARLRSEILPAVCSCYGEGLWQDPRLRGWVGVRVQLREGCGGVEPGGGTSLSDRFVVDCIRGRFIGFAAAPPSQEFPPRGSPWARQLWGQRFSVQIELRPKPASPPVPAAGNRGTDAPVAPR